jgi:hypothetical protein
MWTPLHALIHFPSLAEAWYRVTNTKGIMNGGFIMIYIPARTWIPAGTYVHYKSHVTWKEESFGGLGVDGRIILKWILETQDLGVWTGFNWLMMDFSGVIFYTR